MILKIVELILRVCISEIRLICLQRRSSLNGWLLMVCQTLCTQRVAVYKPFG